jgi:hypothetical protein
LLSTESMRSSPHVPLGFWIVALAASALAGCSRGDEPKVDTTETTKAVVLGPPSVCKPIPSTRSNDAPPMPAETKVSERAFEGSPQPSIATAPSAESIAEPYLRPPLYESHGSTFSDVGIPYALPSVPVEPPAPPVAPPAAPPAPSPFPESSFGP